MTGATKTRVRIEAVYGEWFDHVTVNGKLLDPAPSQALYNHSPNGLSWGYEGSGPAQLALAILYEVTEDEELSLKYHQVFKREVIAVQPQREDWALEIDLWNWLDWAGAGAKLITCAACGENHFGRCNESRG